MLASLGFGFLIITFILALYGVGAALYGLIFRRAAWVESARLAMLATFPILTLSLLALLAALAGGDMQLQVVESVTSHSMPLYLKLTALWGGQPGSLLFWSWLVSIFTFAAARRNWQGERDLLPWVVLIVLSTLAFFLGLSIFIENPFLCTWMTPTGQIITSVYQPAGTYALVMPDGEGLSPLLRHPGMILHPPALYLGFVSFIIPYAFAMAALITGRGGDHRWMRQTRRWVLLAWVFLSLGLLLGMRWAYDVLGWGGYWGWDAVEVSSLLPWLTSTAFLHSLIVQDRRGLFKQWNMLLLILTYALVMWSTFLTRSGMLSSVHAFSQSAIGPFLLAFIGFNLAAALGVLFWRWKDLADDDGPGLMKSLFSREALFLLNNLLFIGLLIVCFWGITFPIISELVTGQKITVGPPYYQRAAGPLFAAIVFLMGLAPLSAWGRTRLKTLGRAAWLPLTLALLAPLALWLTGIRAWPALLGFGFVAASGLLTLAEILNTLRTRRQRTAETWLAALWRLPGRNHRRYGGYIIHMGVVLMALGVLGIETLQSETQSFLSQNQSVSLAGYTLTYRDLTRSDTPDLRSLTCARIDVSRGGQFWGELNPCLDYYNEAQQQVTVPGLRATLADDLYVTLVSWEKASQAGATFKFFHNPLVSWLWIGGLVLIMGAVMAIWPDQQEKD